MARWGMVIDLDRCTGCQDCVIACATENNLAPQGQKEAEQGRTISWMKMLSVVQGVYPDVKVRLIPLPCLHCEKPTCTPVCPVDATNINLEGVVTQTYSRCIGCRYCMAGCPYGVRYFNWDKPSFPKESQGCLNPDVSIRTDGVVEKCTFCHHRLQIVREKAQAEGREIREGEYTPACVQSCPAQAMYFGDLDEPRSTVAKLNKDPRAFRLLEELGTKPKVTYLSEANERIDQQR